MKIFRRQRVIGFLILSLGVGILMAILVPTIGWIIFSAIAMICAGIYLIKC